MLLLCAVARPVAMNTLPKRTPALAARPASVQTASPSPLSDEALALARFALDRALQPIENFEGFQFVDQFQTAATRYQIAQTGYALSLLNARLPAFRGYLREAQENLIHNQTDHRIWRYWRFENAWGNFNLNPDPVITSCILAFWPRRSQHTK